MPNFGMIMAPRTPDWQKIRSLESSYQVAMIADDPLDLRRFIVATQAMQTQALLNTNTQLAEANGRIFDIQQVIGELNTSIQEKLKRQNEEMMRINRLLSTRLEGKAKEIRYSALKAVREGCAPDAFDQEGLLGDALMFWKSTVEDPIGMRDYVAWFNIGWLLWKLEANLEDAERAFATTVRRSMDKKDAYHVMAARHLAYMRYLQKKTDLAYQGIHLALRTSSEDADNLYTLLLIAAQAGNEAEVVTAFRKLIQDHPEQLAICLAEKELEPYSKTLQQVVDELDSNERVKMNDTIERVKEKLHTAGEVATSIGVKTILQKSTREKLDQIQNSLEKTPVDSLVWSSLHDMINTMKKLEDDINKDIEPKKSLSFIHIPAGEFLYGENRQRIRLNSFSIMKYPVTVSQYRLFCEATNRQMPDPPSVVFQL